MLNRGIIISILTLWGSLCCLHAQRPDFRRDIAPIIHQNCTPCHRKGGIAPFELLQYSDVARRANFIAELTQKRVMPPWPADPEVRSFRNEHLLDSSEIETIRKWVETGAPEGRPKIYRRPTLKEPQKQQFRLELAPPDSIRLPGNNQDRYAFFLLDKKLTSDQFLRAARFRPGNRKIVHHCELLAIQDSLLPPDLAAVTLEDVYFDADFNSRFLGNLKYIAGWLPGNEGELYPRGSGIRLDAGTRFLLMVHYGPWPNEATDKTRIELTLTQKPPRRMLGSVDLHGAEHIVSGDLSIPPDTVITFHAKRELREDFSAVSIFPHAHHLAVSMEAMAVLPSNDTLRLLSIPEWDFDWQFNYQLDRHLFLPAGTVIHFWTTYDNTAENPENPHSPPETVRNSFNANDEMMELFIWGYPFNKKDKNKKVRY